MSAAGLPGSRCQETLDVLASPRSVIAAEHHADGVRHSLPVAGIKVELAHKVAVLVGDGDRCLDRPRRDPLSLQPQAVQGEAERGLPRWRAVRKLENAARSRARYGDRVTGLPWIPPVRPAPAHGRNDVSAKSLPGLRSSLYMSAIAWFALPCSVVPRGKGSPCRRMVRSARCRVST